MKDIKGFEGIYAITKDGRVWSYAREVRMGKNKLVTVKFGNKYLMPRKLSTGYLRVGLSIGSQVKECYIHRLVALAFLPNPNNLLQVNHKNGKKDDNRIENLEWCTSSENLSHAFKIGLKSNKGVNQSRSKLSEQDVRNIRLLRRQGLMLKELGKKFGVRSTTISEITNGRNWTHLK